MIPGVVPVPVLANSGRAAPTFIAAVGTAFNSLVSTFTASLPSYAAGDTLIVALHIYNSASTPNTPSGWTLVTSKPTGGTSNPGLYVFSKTATGSEGTSLNISCTGSARGGSMAMSFRGVANAPAGAATNGSSSTTISPPALTSGFGAVATAWLAIGSSIANPTFNTIPSGFTRVTTDIVTSSYLVMSVCYADITAASETPGTFTLSSSEGWASATIGLS